MTPIPSKFRELSLYVKTTLVVTFFLMFFLLTANAPAQETSTPVHQNLSENKKITEADLDRYTYANERRAALYKIATDKGHFYDSKKGKIIYELIRGCAVFLKEKDGDWIR